MQILWGRRIGDAATCYKVLPTALLRDLNLTSRRFELCSEITGRLCQRRVSIREVPIGYRPRGRSEGKKIRATDFFPAVWVLVRERFTPAPAKPTRARVETRPTRV